MNQNRTRTDYKCKTCVWWEERGEHYNNGELLGFCMVNPPSFNTGYHVNAFPQTTENCSCSQHSYPFDEELRWRGFHHLAGLVDSANEGDIVALNILSDLETRAKGLGS